METNDIRISMDGTGSWRDNVSTEWFWWSLKHEHVYPHAYDDLRVAREGIGAYIDYYNNGRRHSSLGKLTPVQAYEQNLPNAASSCPAPANRVAASSPSEAR